ncbi:MAG TPA: YqeG family HAD IIIA-type phosphatase [Bacillota bacterium]|nr:YqeG family HAD IIIA-type phosphatase [Bacillota bacterium]
MSRGERRKTALIQPDMRVNAVWEIDLDELSRRGIAGIIVDIDNTIAPWGTYDVSAPASEWLARARSRGFGVCLLTNNHHSRGGWFARSLGLPVVCGWVKPWRWGYRRAMHILGTHPDSTVMVGDQLFTDILGAKRLGIHAILVSPLSDKELPHTRIKRWLERFLLGRRDDS